MHSAICTTTVQVKCAFGYSHGKWYKVRRTWQTLGLKKIKKKTKQKIVFPSQAKNSGRSVGRKSYYYYLFYNAMIAY